MDKNYWVELRNKRREKGLCLMCGYSKTHQKHLEHTERQRERQRLQRLSFKSRANQTRYRREFLTKYKMEHACQKCGESHFACLQFHHRDPLTKSFEMSSVKAMTVSMRLFNQEFQKCDLLCANCHLKIHYLDRTTIIRQFSNPTGGSGGGKATEVSAEAQR